MTARTFLIPTQTKDKGSFLFYFRLITNSIPKVDFRLLTLFSHECYNKSMKKKATQFETETYGIPKIENIPKDVLDSIVCNLELVISEMYDEAETADANTDTQQ